MSEPPLTLQCYRCTGFFRAAAQAHSRVKCPHCAWVAQANEFRQVHADELGTVGDATPAAAGVEVGGGAWVQKGKHLQFGCPHCERPMRMLIEEAGGLTDCPHCGLEIVSPDPQTGAASRLSDASQRRLGGGRGALKARPRRVEPRSVSLDEAPSLEEAEHTITATPEDPSPAQASDMPSPFEGLAAPASRATPVRMLGVEQLGAAFRARDDIDGPDPLAWEHDGTAPKADKVFNDRRGKIFAFVGAGFLAVLGTIFVVLEFQRRGEVARAASAVGAEQQSAEQTRELRWDTAFDVAQKATGAAAWRDLVPLVRSRQRVAAVMETYYDSHPYTPVELVERIDATESQSGDIQFLQLRVRDAKGGERLVALEVTPAGEFLFDWELWVDIASAEWGDFIEARPTSRVPLRMTIARGAALPRYLDDAGLTEADQARCLRVWLNDSGAPLFAVFPKSDAASNAIWESMTWDLGRRVIAEVSFPAGAKQPDRVVVHRVLQSRWQRQ